jgi:ABC-type nickel/cobalt efflux system permease component RcnA
MEMRHIIAYLLIFALAGSLILVWRYLTRERRAHHRTQKQSERRKLERLARETAA